MSDAVPSPETITPAEAVEVIANDIACPTCEYNLRGLRGSVVECPECGALCDVVTLVLRRWTKPWWKAPGFNDLIYPTVVLWSVLLTPCFLVSGFLLPFICVGLLMIAALYAWTQWRAYRLFNSVRGILLALLVHAIFVMFMIGLLATGGVVALFMMALQQHFSAVRANPPPGPVMGVIVPALVFGVSGVLLWGGKRAERFVAECCIKRYLNGRAALVEPSSRP